jgi:predicted MFS family arabinose efflux permease
VVESAQHQAVSTAQRRTAWVFIVASNFLLSFGFGVWQALFNNFAVEELTLGATQVGLIQSIREVPGLLGFGVGLLALLMTEMRTAGLSIILMGIGITLTGTVGGMPGLVASTLVMSFGFHYFASANSSSVLLLVDQEKGPTVLARLRSLSALFALITSGFVFLTFNALQFRNTYYVVGTVVILGGLALQPWIKQPVRPDRSKRRTPIRKRYWLYYLLEFLMGSRRHIFTTFATYLLVKDHAVAIQTITLLLLLNNLLGTFVFRQFGKIIDRFGERRVLTFNFVVLILVFLGYAFISWLPLLFILFVADNLLFGFRIALETYFQKTALRPEDITPNLSLGQGINHIAAVIIPVVGGIVWETIGARYTFIGGVVIAVVTLVLAQWVRTGSREAVEN